MTDLSVHQNDGVYGPCNTTMSFLHFFIFGVFVWIIQTRYKVLRGGNMLALDSCLPQSSC